LKGTVSDVVTGDPVLTDQGSEGTRIRLRELSWTETKVPDNYDFYCMKEGIFQDTKVLKVIITCELMVRLFLWLDLPVQVIQ